MKTYSLIFTTLLTAGWCFAGAATESETNYYALFIDQQKSGHMTTTRTEENGKVTTDVTVEMSMKRMGVAIKVISNETYVETTDGKPLAFSTTQQFSGMTMHVKGTVRDGKTIEVVSESMGQRQEYTMPWPKGALMAEGVKRVQEKKGYEAGAEYTVKIFSPTTLSALDTHIQVGELKKVDLLGRVTMLREVHAEIPELAGGMKEITYINEEGESLKTITNMMGINLEMIACDKHVALAEDVDPVEFFDRFIIKSPVDIGDINKIESIIYTIKSSSGRPLDFPETAAQTVTPIDPCTWELTVTPPTEPDQASFVYTGDDPAIEKYLKPARFIQSETPRIRELAGKALDDADTAAAALTNIETFVSDYIREKNLSVGYASALEVAKTREGDCSEHALLTAALCRAVGIPSQVVVGLVYVPWPGYEKGIFGPHAWTRAYVSGQWIGLDATGGPRGYTAGHITLGFGNGNPEDYFDTITLQGQFRITGLRVNP